VRGVVLSILVGAIVMAGCGGGTTRSTTQVESKANFIALADVICKNHQSRREDLESQTIDLGRLNSRDKAHQVAELLRQQRSNLVREVNELQGRQPPPDEVGRVRSVLASIRAKADLIGAWAKAYDDRNVAEIRRQQVRIGLATAKMRKAARAYGFEVCGQD
jgi:hypothetical protein